MVRGLIAGGRVLGRLLAVATLLAAAGCATSKTVRSRLVPVAVTMPGIATVEGRSCSVDSLHLLLPKLKIATHDRIEVMLPKDGQHLYARVRASLLQGGYRSVRYKLPKHTRAYITPEEDRRLQKFRR